MKRKKTFMFIHIFTISMLIILCEYSVLYLVTFPFNLKSGLQHSL